MSERCWNCRFYKSPDRHDDYGRCRRYAPGQVEPDHWPPRVDAEQWCGEWQPTLELSRQRIAEMWTAAFEAAEIYHQAVKDDLGH